MDDLVEFLRARLDEDEAHVRSMRPRFVFVPSLRDPSAPTRDEIAAGVDPEEPERAQAMRDIQAKRRIIEDLTGTLSYLKDGGSPYEADHESTCERVLKLLALPYAEHPDYDEAWRA